MKKYFIILAFVFLCPKIVFAQDSAEIKSLIEGGWKSYVAKDYIDGAEKLEKASNLMRSARLQTFKPFLPNAPEGWTVKEEKDSSETAGLGGAMLGGMSMLNRKFLKGTEVVNLQIITDSPLFTSIISMLKLMPAGTEQQQGYEKYKTYFAQYEAGSEANKYTIFEDNGLAVSIEGPGMTKDTAIIFADKIDFDGLLQAIKK